MFTTQFKVSRITARPVLYLILGYRYTTGRVSAGEKDYIWPTEEC